MICKFPLKIPSGLSESIIFSHEVLIMISDGESDNIANTKIVNMGVLCVTSRWDNNRMIISSWEELFLQHHSQWAKQRRTRWTRGPWRSASRVWRKLQMTSSSCPGGVCSTKTTITLSYKLGHVLFESVSILRYEYSTRI